MRRFFLSFVLLATICGIVDAEAQHIVKQRVGAYNDGSEIVVREASTTLISEVVVQHEMFVAGLYARYAQKFLGERAPLVDRNEYRIIGADVAVLASSDCCTLAADVAAEDECADIGFGLIPIDRLSMEEQSLESAAYAAAEQIYALRRARLELVTGELGEGVFGEGLRSALREIERLEAEYLALFFGKRHTCRSVKHFVLPVEEGVANYVVARFHHEEGIVAQDDLSGDIVMVTIRPTDMTYPAGNPKGRTAYRYANNARVSLSYGSEQLVERQLPIYEFGQTIYF